MAEPAKTIPKAAPEAEPKPVSQPVALDAVSIGKRFIARYPKIMAKLAE